MGPSRPREHLHSEPSGLEAQRFSCRFQPSPAEHGANWAFMEPSAMLEHQLSTTLNTNIFHSGNGVYITIKWSEWPPVNTHKHHPEKRAIFSSEEIRIHSTEKPACSNLLKQVLRNKTALTLITAATLLAGHYSLTQLGSLLLAIWITSFLQNLNINFIGKSMQRRFPHREGTHETRDHRQALKF